MPKSKKRYEKRMTVVEFAKLTGVSRQTLMWRLENGVSILAAAFSPHERKKIPPRHGHAIFGAHTPTYNSWQSMTQRCTNASNTNFGEYGGRGISVCERWRKFESFLEDMGNRPVGTTLDRIDVNGNYEASNCRWATPAEQTANRRTTLIYELDGKRMPLKDWALHLGIGYQTLRIRIREYGWTPERALTTPVLIDRSKQCR